MKKRLVSNAEVAKRRLAAAETKASFAVDNIVIKNPDVLKIYEDYREGYIATVDDVIAKLDTLNGYTRVNGVIQAR